MRTRPTMSPGILLVLLIVPLAACTDPGSPGFTAPHEGLIAATDGVCALGVTDSQANTLIESLRVEIAALEATGALNAGQASALRSHLGNVLRHIGAGRYCPALAQLEAFRDQVREFVEDGVLTEAEAEPLEAGSRSIIEGLPEFPNQVIVAAPSPAAGTYDATGAAFGPVPDLTGVSAGLEIAVDGVGAPDACEPLVGFTAGAIAIVDRGTCTFVLKALNAQAAGAVAMIVVQNTAGSLFRMGGASDAVTIPSVMISLADGAVIKAGLPATGTVRRTP